MDELYLRLIKIALMIGTIIGIYGCGSDSPGINNATATAQAERAIHLATRIAIEVQSTQSARSEQNQATAQAVRATIQAAPKWPVVFSDAFDDNRNDWPTGEKLDPLANITRNIADGRYKWKATANEAFAWWTYPDIIEVSNFHLSVNVKQVSGPEDGEYGLVFRLTDDEDYYLFEISQLGHFGVFMRYQDAWVTLQDWRESDAIRPGDMNLLTVIAAGSHLSFYINDQPVAELFDEHLVTGKSGTMIGLSNVDDEAVWEFDNFELRAPGP